MSTTQTVLDLDQVCVNTMRTLAIDAIQKANSGHPGTPMGMSPTVYCLWQRLLRFDPEDPIWMNRDRFVLSAGHASTLLYTILHLARVKAVDPEYEILGRPSVTLDDLKSFRQFGSRCARHPEYRWTSGVGMERRSCRGCQRSGSHRERGPECRRNDGQPQDRNHR